MFHLQIFQFQHYLQFVNLLMFRHSLMMNQLHLFLMHTKTTLQYYLSYILY